MVSISLLTEVLWFISLLGNALTAVKLQHLGLWRVYRYFFPYLCFRTLRSTILFLLTNAGARNAYSWTWVLTEPLLWAFYVLVALELYWLALRNYPGIYTMSRWMLTSGLVVGVSISTLSLWLTWGQAPEHSRVLGYYIMIERGIDSTLVIFLLVLAAFLAWYPVAVTRNALRHTAVYSIYFLSSTGAMLARHLLGAPVSATVNTVLMAIASVCSLLWFFLFTRQGEELSLSLRERISGVSEEALVEHLRALNTTLARAGQR